MTYTPGVAVGFTRELINFLRGFWCSTRTQNTGGDAIPQIESGMTASSMSLRSVPIGFAGMKYPVWQLATPFASPRPWSRCGA